VSVENRESKLSSLHLADSGFLFDPYTGLTYGLNATGAAILQWLRDGLALPEVARKLASEFDVPEPTAVADAKEFYDALERQGLLWTK
jgi:PqqD family protein of HPr-rel-A system